MKVFLKQIDFDQKMLLKMHRQTRGEQTKQFCSVLFNVKRLGKCCSYILIRIPKLIVTNSVSHNRDSHFVYIRCIQCIRTINATVCSGSVPSDASIHFVASMRSVSCVHSVADLRLAKHTQVSHICSAVFGQFADNFEYTLCSIHAQTLYY